jgi:hypothetical protein
MQHLPSTPPPPLPATERAIHEAELAFGAGHRVPLVAGANDAHRPAGRRSRPGAPMPPAARHPA